MYNARVCVSVCVLAAARANELTAAYLRLRLQWK